MIYVTKNYTINTGFSDTLLFEQGEVLSPNDNGMYSLPNGLGEVSRDFLLEKSEFFSDASIGNTLEMNSFIIEETEDDIIKNYRIQLDVKTSFRKLKEMEEEIRDIVARING